MAILLLSSCNALKFVPATEKLYTGSDLEMEAPDDAKGTKVLKDKVEDVIGPEPNSRFLRMRVGLWAHYKVERGDSGFIPRFINRKWGEEPVYLSEVRTAEVEKLILNRCENSGFFYSEVSSEVRQRKRTASVDYHLRVSHPYLLEKYVYLRDSILVDKLIRTSLKNSELKPGSRFDIDDFNRERDRIDEFLKKVGYYNFNPTFLIFTTDTSQYEDRRYDLYLSFKEGTPGNTQIQYKINKVYVFPTYSIECNEEKGGDTTIVDDIVFVQDTFLYKPRLLRDFLSFEPGDDYSRKQENITNRRFSAIGSFQLVSLRFKERKDLSDSSLGMLDAYILLSPAKKQALRLELQGITKSTGFVGPGLTGTYRNRNLFKGGELFEISGKASYETQFSRGTLQGLSSFQFQLNNSITYPRLITPVRINRQKGYTIPKTKFSLNYTLQDRAQYYKLNSFQFIYGYHWNTTRLVYQEVNPFSITYTSVTEKTPEFSNLLEENAFLARSFENQFIPAINYTYRYSELGDNKKNRFYFNFSGEAAGTFIGLAQQALDAAPKLFGLPYAQYGKADFDLRHYFNTAEESRLVTRFFAGAGFPYGNSRSLPYVKQYFAGGPNSIRAFRVRSLGPGSYSPPEEETSTLSFFDQAGDIRLEFNTEYRFPMVSLLKGAVFVDAGNVWLMNENPDLPGGKFGRDWFNELAVGTGFGFRLDIRVLVIRLDLAFPLRYPVPQEDGNYWQQDFAFGYRSWRRENLIFNFAIGYPF